LATAAFLIFHDEQRYLEISDILPYLPIVERMPSSAGPLFSTDPPFISAAAMRVSRCLQWALLLGKVSILHWKVALGFTFWKWKCSW